MAKQTQTYTTLRAFPHRGEVIAKGGTVELHPSQAKYLLGTHLEAAASAKTPAKAKAAPKPNSTEGDQ